MRLTRFDFYPRSPCGERHTGYCFVKACETFLSTLSLRRATTWDSANCDVTVISIHALLAESDAFPAAEPVVWTHFYPRSPCGERLKLPSSWRRNHNFYPRSPCGERQNTPVSTTIFPLFLSTLSLRRATIHDDRFLPIIYISIHALLAESDGSRTARPARHPAFLSTLSLRRATVRARAAEGGTPISIHALPYSV